MSDKVSTEKLQAEQMEADYQRCLPTSIDWIAFMRHIKRRDYVTDEMGNTYLEVDTVDGMKYTFANEDYMVQRIARKLNMLPPDRFATSFMSAREQEH